MVPGLIPGRSNTLTKCECPGQSQGLEACAYLLKQIYLLVHACIADLEKWTKDVTRGKDVDALIKAKCSET